MDKRFERLRRITYWKALHLLQDNYRRHRDDSLSWQNSIVSRNVRGYGVDISDASQEADQCHKQALIALEALQSQFALYVSFVELIRSEYPESLCKLPLAENQDIYEADPKLAALSVDSILAIVADNPIGISVRDIFVCLGDDHKDIAASVKRFVDSGKIKATKIGKHGKQTLYVLSELLRDFSKYSPMSKAEKQSLYKQLLPLQRKPTKKF